MRIVNFGQVVDLEHGTQIAHQFTVMLPSGQRVQVRTDEETVQQLVAALTGNGVEPPQPTRSKTLGEILAEETQEPSQIEPDSFDAGDVFGGDYDPGELAANAASSLVEQDYEPEPVMGTMAEEPVMPQAAPTGGLGQPAPKPRQQRQQRVDSDGFVLPTRSRTVPKDEMGYPIVSQRAPQQTLPIDDGEEDGQQI